MTDPRDPLRALPAVDPADEAAREARHELIASLLAAHADRELPLETASQLEAHLVGCVRCRRELALQHAVRGRLAEEATPGAPPALRLRVAERIAALPAPAAPAPPVAPARRRRLAISLVATAAVAAAALVATLGRDGAPAPGGDVRWVETSAAGDALLRGVAADYRRVAAEALPGRARDVDAVRAAVPFPVEPLEAPGLRLLAAWTTSLDGEPAAVLAYRSGDRLVVQYLVSDAHLFRSPAVRAGVAAAHLVGARDGALALLAWPTASAGSVLVGEVPPETLADLWAARRVADRDAGGAQ